MRKTQKSFRAAVIELLTQGADPVRNIAFVHPESACLDVEAFSLRLFFSAFFQRRNIWK
jgi:hypothetical protein